MSSSKFNLVAFLFFLFLAPLISAAEVCNYLPGKIICGQGTVANITKLGLVMLDGTTVTDSINVTGSLLAHQANLNKTICLGKTNLAASIVTGLVEIIGEAKFTTTKLHAAVKIIGTLFSDNSSFEQNLEVTALEISLQHTYASNINMHGDALHKQKIYLKNSSMVFGDITFSSKNGLVIISDGSEVKGKVIGGEIIKLD